MQCNQQRQDFPTPLTEQAPVKKTYYNRLLRMNNYPSQIILTGGGNYDGRFRP